MRKLAFVALLASTAMPASAFTYAVYEATGPGSTLDSFTGWQIGIAHVQLIVPLEDQSPSWDYYNMFAWGFSGAQVRGYATDSRQGQSELFLTFDHSLTGFPLSAEGFLSGTAKLSLGHYTSLWASLDTLKVSTITNDGYIGGLSGWLQVPGVPEPASWAMMIGGFALAGAVMRRQAAKVRFKIA